MRLLVWVDRQGVEEPLNAAALPYEVPRVSPDGGHVAVEVNSPDGRYVMVYDLQRDSPARLMTEPGVYRNPLWSLDGQRVLFTYRGGIRARAADGTGPMDQLVPPNTNAVPQSWSADGRAILVQVGEDIGLISVGTGQLTELIQTDGSCQ